MNTRLAPSNTPFSLRVLLGLIFLLSALSSFVGPYLIFSYAGIHHLYFWQFATYLFIHPFPAGILHLAFNLYLIWIFGASLLERLHQPSFFLLFFGSGIAAALSAWGAMAALHLPATLMGSSSALYGLLTAWIILNPDARLFLFFALPLKARYLLLGLIGFNLLIDLSRSDWIPLFAFIGAILFSYFFTVISCRTRSPFSFLSGLETEIFWAIEQLSRKKKPMTHTKIYDFKSGEPVLNDEQFMDAMLSRISLYGEDSLSPEDKVRMQRISEKKSMKKNN